MDRIELYKGIAPGRIISHEIKKYKLSQKDLANRLKVQNQVISSIVTGKRSIPEKLSYKLDDALGFDIGFFLLIQTYYRIRMHKANPHITNKEKPIIRPAVFWDVDIDKLDWDVNKSFIIRRVTERGNQLEQEQVKSYYEL